MGTSAEAVKTDKLGRRSGPRRKYTVEEKRAMVEQRLCLFFKRLERGKFVWPQATSGTVSLTGAQLSGLLPVSLTPGLER
jgi:IS66 Orf2 like protein